jgi:hypothetical protein
MGDSYFYMLTSPCMGLRLGYLSVLDILPPSGSIIIWFYVINLDDIIISP